MAINTVYTETAYVWEVSPTSNQYDRLVLMDAKYYGLSKFDLYSEIGTGKYIKSAQHHVYVVNYDSTQSNPCFLTSKNVTEDYLPHAVTYGTKPATGAFTSQASIARPAKNAWGHFNIDVTDLIRGSYNAGSFFGLQHQSAEIHIATAANFPGDLTKREYLTIDWCDTAPQTPVVTYPTNNLKYDASTDMVVTWNAPSSINSRIKINDGTDHITLISGGSNTFTIPAGTYTGTYTISVQSEYSDSGWSEYSTAITAIPLSKPATPVITTSSIGSQLPLISWTGETSTAWNVQIYNGSNLVVNYTGYNNNKSYQLTTKLEDNVVYTIKVRISTEMWSDYATKTITSSFLKPGTPSFTIQDFTKFKYLVVTQGANTSYYEVMKQINGDWVTLLTSTASGINVYELISEVDENLKIRAYRDTGGYKDSASQDTTLTVTNTDLIMGTVVLNLKNTPSKSISNVTDAVGVSMAGRQKQVAFVGVSNYDIPDFNFETFDASQVETLRSFVGNKILIRDNRGYTKWFVLGSLGIDYNNLSYTVTLKNLIEVAR